jgi:hypothetical protein
VWVFVRDKLCGGSELCGVTFVVIWCCGLGWNMAVPDSSVRGSLALTYDVSLKMRGLLLNCGVCWVLLGVKVCVLSSARAVSSVVCVVSWCDAVDSDCGLGCGTRAWWYCNIFTVSVVSIP